MSWVVALITGWLLFKLLMWLGRLGWRAAKALWRRLRGRSNAWRHYRLTPAHNHALALAHPAATHRFQNGFADLENPTLDEQLAREVRPALLHWLGLRPDLGDAGTRSSVQQRLREGWFALDLQALDTSDEPRDAMAFACARVAMGTRCAGMLGWLDERQQWQVLNHNAARAVECFDSWQDFGRACARGRRQWVSRGRADSLGVAFAEADVDQWVHDRKHPWSRLSWSIAGSPEGACTDQQRGAGMTASHH